MGDIGRAEQTLLVMRSEGHVPDANTYSALLNACQPGLRDPGGSSSKGPDKGPPQDRAEVDAMLKRGAHDIFINDEDDAAYQKFNEADIDEILQSSSTKITYEADAGSGSVFSKAAFVSDDNTVDTDDPEPHPHPHPLTPSYADVAGRHG